MTITFTKKYTSTFKNDRPRLDDPDSPVRLLAASLHQMISEGKTDGEWHQIDLYSGFRFFVDQDSAQAWADLGVSAWTQLGRTDFNYTITDV